MALYKQLALHEYNALELYKVLVMNLDFDMRKTFEFCISNIPTL